MARNLKSDLRTNLGVDNFDANELIFALDIGTRSVVGTLGIMDEDEFKVIDFEQRYHNKRTMRDGQIEDIELVANVVRQVKEELEKRNKVTLKKVGIAAAGRSLKTVKTLYEQAIDVSEEISVESMNGLEYAALSQAMDEFGELGNKMSSFYCVGYSVIRMSLDDYNMSNLVGHKGNKVELEIIAAFLPHNVVEGLYSCMRLNDLEIENLTLEPMAAIHVIVPKDIRLLNIALVDIGAGTSDIAISKNGGISAYDMVTVAGDELTEKIMQAYITDFDEAEKIKMLLENQKETINYRDVLGNNLTVKASEVYAMLLPAINDFVNTITERILQINGNSPVAVFVVGGGSQILGLCEMISKGLQIPENRVTVGGKTGMKYIKTDIEEIKSPEFVTPIGIGAIMSERKGKDFFSITVNGNKILMLRQGEIKVMDAILLAGIKPTALIGTPQPTLHYYLNGEKRYHRGAEQISGELKVNSKPASIETLVAVGDEITVIPARTSGKSELTIEDLLLDFQSLKIKINGENAQILPDFFINEADSDDRQYVVKLNDKIQIRQRNILGDILREYKIDYDKYLLKINGEDATAQSFVKQNDAVEFMLKTNAPKVEVVGDLSTPKVLNEIKITVCINGSWKKIPVTDGQKPIFADMLSYTNIQNEEPRGQLVLKLNSKYANYAQHVADGDFVEIRWSEDK